MLVVHSSSRTASCRGPVSGFSARFLQSIEFKSLFIIGWRAAGGPGKAS
jgi:hypothetical protein